MSRDRDVLLLAWGNPARLDDGLGPSLALTAADWEIPGLRVVWDYQLQVEHADDASRHTRVIFVDADRACAAPFRVQRLHPGSPGIGFSTHSLAPERVLALARDLFAARPDAWLVGIRGYDFDGFGERLSKAAHANLIAAAAYLRAAIESGAIQEIDPARAPEAEPAGAR